MNYKLSQLNGDNIATVEEDELLRIICILGGTDNPDKSVFGRYAGADASLEPMTPYQLFTRARVTGRGSAWFFDNLYYVEQQSANCN